MLCGRKERNRKSGTVPPERKRKRQRKRRTVPFWPERKGKSGTVPPERKRKDERKRYTGMNYKGKGDKGKGDRQRCWNCGNYGHFSKECKMTVNAVDYVTDDTQE